MLTRETLLGVTAKPIGKITVPELGGDIGIRALSAAEFMEFRNRKADETKGIESTAELAVKLLANEDGSRMFADGDAPLLYPLGYIFLERIVKEGFALNGIGKEAQETTEKN